MSVKLEKLGIRIKSPGKNPPEKIPLNAIEHKPVPTKVLNPNASKASYKPKHRSYRKTKLIFLYFFFRGHFSRGDFIREPKNRYGGRISETESMVSALSKPYIIIQHIIYSQKSLILYEL